MAILELQDITKIYENKKKKITALNGINLSIEKGEWISVFGEEGSGKSSLFNIMASLDKPTSGKIILDGKDITSIPVESLVETRRDKIGLIFSQAPLIPYLTVLENLKAVQFYHSMSDETEAMEALEIVGIGHLSKKLPKNLTKEERQLTCIARSFINQPEIIIADEPVKNLNDDESENIIKVLRRLHDDGRTILITTGKKQIAALGERTIILENGSIIG